MTTEEECKPQEKYLFTAELFSDESISIWKNECVERCENRDDKGEEYERYINWKRKDNEVALFILYAYADIKIPKQFDCIFELKNPSNFIVTKFTLTQAIWEAWFPLGSLDHGHKHLCVFEFEDEIPQILKKLHIIKNKFSDAPRGSLLLGICQRNNFEEIKTARELINSRGF
ncbi:hypothetical protein V9L05_19370 [Bernardetia sp. Wsw4-3y2]|uniref:hypothetical protein n=1 Tax=Bernardetia sp. Wsw4-3y2 TaxID=3127471 RepID=UPI0030CEA179